MAKLVTQDFGAIDFVETYESPRSPLEAFSLRDSSVTRVYLVGWEDRLRFAMALLGYPQVAAWTNGKPYIRRVLPDHYAELEVLNPTPHAPEALYASRVLRAEGMGAQSSAYTNGLSGPVSRYTKCRLEVEYTQPDFTILGDQRIISSAYEAPDEALLQRFVSIAVRPSAEYARLPTGAFLFVDGTSKPVPGTPGRLVPGNDLTISWRQVPQDAAGLSLLNAGKTTITDCIGRVNRTTFAGAEPGTLLLTAVNIVRYRCPFGYWLCDLEHRFKFSDAGAATSTPTDARAGHNHLFAPWPTLANGAGHYEISTDGNTNINIQALPGVGTENALAQAGSNVYDWADFAPLFRPAT